MRTKKRDKIIFRRARPDDVSALIALEKEVWGESGANHFQICARIETFPRGNIVATQAGLIVGYVSFQYVADISAEGFTWSEITDNGTIQGSHKPDGDYIYGINLSVAKGMNGFGLGTALVLQGWADMIRYNKKGSFIGSRIPGFASYRENHPGATAEEYIQCRRKGELRDPELRLYAKEGLLPVKVLPDYFPDPASLNYGVLVYRKNPFYNWPFRKFWAVLITKIAPKFIRQNIAVSKGD